MLEESDTYLMILEKGEERGEERTTRRDILLVGEARLGPPDEGMREKVGNVTDLEQLKRMLVRAATALTWQEIVDSP